MMKNKKYILVFVLGIALSNCLALDTTGVSDSYIGKEARAKIIEAGYIADLWAYGLVYGPENAVILSTVDGALVGIYSKIDNEKYYPKADVDKCADDIKNFGILLISDASTTTLLSSNCSNLKPNGSILP